ncbi:3-oxoacyl-ACP reductase [Anopheles sinensis]|uniref:3-oxoacyl-ACP reductase n=1 Tax=Anopheles sinensis TaxID=74873 RepID=A0A084VR91_ANOSI|nr:3-oxoacyl-ACP reductase [Anopheles sinensis]
MRYNLFPKPNKDNVNQNSKSIPALGKLPNDDGEASQRPANRAKKPLYLVRSAKGIRSHHPGLRRKTGNPIPIIENNERDLDIPTCLLWLPCSIGGRHQAAMSLPCSTARLPFQVQGVRLI